MSGLERERENVLHSRKQMGSGGCGDNDSRFCCYCCWSWKTPESKLGLDVVGPGNLTVVSNTQSLVQVLGTDIGCQTGILLPQRLGNLITLRRVLAVDVLDPFTSDTIKLGLESMAFSDKLLLLSQILHGGVLVGGTRDVLVLPIIKTLVVGDGEAVAGDDLVELGVVAGEDKLGGDDGVEEGLDQLPETPEDEGCAVDDTNSEGLGVV